MFEEFIKKFGQTLEDCLEELCERHNLYYDYSYKKVYNWCKFDVTVYVEEKYGLFHSMFIDFILEETDKGIVIKAEVKDKPTKIISRRKTCQRMDKLKTSILKAMEELLAEDLKELKRKLRILEYIYKMKEIAGKHDCWNYGLYDPTVVVEITKSKMEIRSEYSNDKLYPKEIEISFERKEECEAFASFIESFIENYINKSAISADVFLSKITIDLTPLEPKKRFDTVKRVIEALEMLYLI